MATKQIEEQDLEKYIEEDLFDEDSSKLDEGDLKNESVEALLTSSDWTTETIVNQIMKGNIDLDPDFQRREAWTDIRRSRFIESLFMGLPVPQLVLAEREEQRGTYMVLDGKQRLLAIRRFASPGKDDKFTPLILTGLEIRHDLNGRTLEDIRHDTTLTNTLAAYENQTIRSVVVRNWKSDDVLYRIFIRLNTGNLPLSNQELRQALFPGPFMTFANDYSANSTSLQKALRINKPDFRMRDVEILIRFFAFRRFIDTYKGNLKDFLDDTCKKLNAEWQTGNEENIKEIAKTCDAAIEATVEIFGRNAFRLWEHGSYRRPFNRAVFDVMVYYLSQNEETRQQAIKKMHDIEKAFQQLSEKDYEFHDSLRLTTKSIDSTFGRLRKWGQVLLKELEIPVNIPQAPR